MFRGFEQQSPIETRRRYALSTGASVTIYAVVGVLAVLLAKSEAPAVTEKQVEVVFRGTPEVRPAPAPRSAAPPPALPQNIKVKRVAVVAAPRPLVSPTKVSEQKHAEADPAQDAVEVGDGAGTGSQEGVEGGTAPASAPPVPSPPPPPPRRQHAEPINLPENATPPVADSSNQAPEYPEEARTQGLEGQVILKIVVSESGEVTKIEVLRGEEPFVAAAIAAVRAWHYNPALVDGRPTAVFRIVKLPFRLRS